MFVKGFTNRAGHSRDYMSPCSNVKELLSAFETSEERASERPEPISKMAQDSGVTREGFLGKGALTLIPRDVEKSSRP